MLLPRKIPKKVAAVVYPIICGLHGLAFGALYAPAHAIMYGFSFEQTVAWIIAGLTFDVVHAVGNFAAGMLILPFSELLTKLYRKTIRYN